MKPVFAVTLALLGGCSLFRAEPQQVVEETPIERACRVEARRSPDVRALWAQANPSVTNNSERLAGERRLAENRAFTECLRRAGQAVPGGVEAQRPR